jgi:hypothetical protein
MLLIAICALLIAVASHAQPAGNLGVYADPGGTVCVLEDPGPQLIQYYVVHNLTPAAQAVRFKAPVPSCMNGAVWISDDTAWPIKIGLVPDGTLIGYGGCVSALSPILVMTINIFGLGMSDECCLYPLLPDPSGVTGLVEVQGCDDVWYAATGVAGVINANPTTCWCEVPTWVTTWGRVKALYTD